MDTPTADSPREPDITPVNPASGETWFGHPRQLIDIDERSTEIEPVARFALDRLKDISQPAQVERDWRGNFMASAFVLVGRRRL